MKILLTAILLLIVVFILFNWERHCPKCRRIFARKQKGKKIMGRKTKEEYGWNDKKGKDTKIIAKYKTVKYDYQCKYCKHKWSEKKMIDG